MACIVEVKDIFKKIKNEILNFDGVKPTPSGVFYTYRKSDNKDLPNTLKKYLVETRKKYKEEIFGKLIEISKDEYGIHIDIIPTESLAEAMTDQNLADELNLEQAVKIQNKDSLRVGKNFSKDYLFNSRTEMPEGNNYKEFTRYKQLKLEDIQNEINRLFFKLRNIDLTSNEDVISINKNIKSLEKEMAIINRQLEALSKEEPKYMFHALLEDIQILEEALYSDNLVDINRVNNTLSFYSEFIKGENTSFIGGPLSEYNNELYSDIIGGLQELEDKANSKIYEISKNTVLASQAVKELEGKNKDLDTDTLFQAQKDITWFEKWNLGLSADRTNNTIIPQALLILFGKTLFKKQSTIEKWKKELLVLIEANPDLRNPDFIREKDENGKETGYIINLYTPLYYKTIIKYKKLLSKYTKESSEENYREVIKEMLQHNTVVDFTRIRAIKDLYYDKQSDYFTHSEEDMIKYEESLKKGLGPKYEEVVDQILSRLALFEEKGIDAEQNTSVYAKRDLASQNIWKFNKLMQGSVADFNKKIPYTVEGDNQIYGVHFKDFNNISLLPKSPKLVTDQGVSRDLKFYNQDFKDIAKEQSKLEYWKLVKKISEYISSTYDTPTSGRISYPKIQREYAERLQKGIKDRNLSSLFLDTAKEYKSWFFERGRVKNSNHISPNYIDSSKKEIKDLADTYIMQGINKEKAFLKAREEILSSYSNDFNSNLLGVAKEAALHDARIEVKPMAEAHIKYFKHIGKDRKNAIEKLEHFYEKIILNTNEKYRGTDKIEDTKLSTGTWLNRALNLLQTIPYINRKITNKATYFLSDNETKIFKELLKVQEAGDTKSDYIFEVEGVTYIQKEGVNYQSLGEEVEEITRKTFNKAFQSHVETKIEKLGLDLNLAGVINGILKTVIFKGLALNPISGIFNRIEGKHSSMIMDATGEYWTTGNIDVANSIMAFANINRLSKGRLSPLMRGRKDTLAIFNILVKQFNILQDRKNELQRSAEEAHFDREITNPFIWAVENPEYKNQGAIIMSLLMDKTITDIEGISYPILDPTTKEFTAYKLVDGKLKLKENFRTTENINTFENFTGDNLSNMVVKMTDAVSRSQGNYNVFDIMMAKKNIWGRSATVFMTWFAEHLNQRFGNSGDSNYNLATGKKRRDGRFIEAYKTNKLNTTIAGTIGLTVSYGLGGTLLASAGFAGLGFMVYKKFVKKIASPEANIREISYGLELAEFIKSLLVESLNYPGRLLNISDKIRLNNSTFEKTNMSKEEIASMRALTRELAIVLSWLAMKLAMGALLYEDDDDKESDARMRHNFIQNQLSRTINTLTVYTNPQQLISDHSRIAALKTVSASYQILLAAFNEEQRKKLGKNLLEVSPIPRILTKGMLPWHDKMNYDELSNFSGIPSPLLWTSKLYKDSSTEGEYSAKKEYMEIVKKLRKDLKKEYILKHKGKKKPLKKEIDKLIKKKINGYKKTKQTYKEKLLELEKLGLR